MGFCLLRCSHSRFTTFGSERVPKWVRGKRPKEWWRKPWTVPQSGLRARGFKRKLWKHGYLSPNFTRKEAASKDGTPVPKKLRKKAQYHAFGLERVRHACGDKSMAPLSWYRSPAHNAAVGGVSNSQHLQAWATDWSDSTRASLGEKQFDDAMHYHFRNGGRGVVGGTRHIRHVDNGTKRSWSY